MNHRILFAFVGFLYFALVPSGHGQTPTPHSLSTIVVETLESRWVVALGENHGHVEFHTLLRDLLSDAAVQSVVDDLVVEFGNALYQDVIDQYVNGEPVPYDSVRLAWRNTIVSPNTVWDSPVYEQFFQHVRAVNLQRTDDRRYRIILADSPVDWATVTSIDDLRPFFDRSMSMSGTVEREVLRKGRRALLIAGGAHLTRRNMVRKNRSGVPTAEVSVVSRLALRHPGSLFVIRSLGKGRGLDHAIFADIPKGSLLFSNIPSIRSISANSMSSMRNRDGSPFDAYGTATLGDLVDAVIYWGPEEENHFADAPSSVYLDDDYWETLNQRSMLLRGQPMDPALRQTKD